MYSEAELEALMQASESDCLEYKESATDGRSIRRIICAFANDLPGNNRPGILLIGVRDDGTCAGLSVDDKLLRQLGDVLGEGSIMPLPSMTVKKHVSKGCEVAVVSVKPAADPPVRYQGRVWVRVGSSVRAGSAADERLLSERRRSGDLPFDMRATSTASLDDLDLEFLRSHYLPRAVARDVLEQNTRPLEQQLRSLRLTRETRPTWGAVLAFGRDPQYFLPGAYVQFLHIDGTELTDPIRLQKELTGRLDDVLRRLGELLELAVSVRIKITGAARERRQPDYPVDALRQLAYNAIMHRSYESTNAPVRVYWFKDRVEIISPGGLYGRITKTNFGTGDTDYRNPLVAEIMRNLGYAQRFGMGIPTAREALKKNNNPEAEFSFETTLVGVTLRSAP